MDFGTSSQNASNDFYNLPALPGSNFDFPAVHCTSVDKTLQPKIEEFIQVTTRAIDQTQKLERQKSQMEKALQKKVNAMRKLDQNIKVKETELTKREECVQAREIKVLYREQQLKLSMEILKRDQNKLSQDIIDSKLSETRKRSFGALASEFQSSSKRFQVQMNFLDKLLTSTPKLELGGLPFSPLSDTKKNSHVSSDKKEMDSLECSETLTVTKMFGEKAPKERFVLIGDILARAENTYKKCKHVFRTIGKVKKWNFVKCFIFDASRIYTSAGFEMLCYTVVKEMLENNVNMTDSTNLYIENLSKFQ